MTWQRRALRLARRVGLTVTDLRPGTALLSRSGAYEVQALVPDESSLVSRRRKTRGARPAGGGIAVAAVGSRGWLVSRRDPAPAAHLALETQTMKYLGTRHVAWLLEQYEIDCVLDVGANTGQYGRALRRAGYTGHIVSFEPVPRFVEALNEAAANDDKWTVRQVALGSTEGTVPIRVQHSLSSALASTPYGRRRFKSLADNAEGQRVVEVPLRRLDAVLDDVLAPVTRDDGRRPRVFLKLDTQGFDLEAFAGLGERASDVIGLQSEVALLLIYEQMPRMPEALGVYEAAGFEITGFFPITREPDGRVIEYDCMMVRSDEWPAGSR